jgi:molecular chaperone GrpE
MSEKKKSRSKDMDPKALRKELEESRRQLESLQKEKAELFDKLQRVSADYANFQKRSARQIGDSVAYEKENLIKTLLPILDNFEHTLQKSHTAESVEVVLKGVQIVYDQMVNTLASHGVEQIHALDETFDPARHEAMLRREEPDRPDHAVLEEFQKGYQLNGRVIRPSKVVVNRVQAEEAPASAEEPAPPAGEVSDEAQDEQETASERETDTEQ